MNLGVSHFGPRVAKDLGLLNLGGRHTNPQPPPQSQERSLCGVRIARARIRISRQLLILLVRVLGQAPPNLWRHLFYTISHYIIIFIIIFIIFSKQGPDNRTAKLHLLKKASADRIEPIKQLGWMTCQFE